MMSEIDRSELLDRAQGPEVCLGEEDVSEVVVMIVDALRRGQRKSMAGRLISPSCRPGGGAKRDKRPAALRIRRIFSYAD